MRDYVPFAIGIGVFALAFAVMAWQAWLASPDPSGAQLRFVDMCEKAATGSLGFVFGYAVRTFTRRG